MTRKLIVATLSVTVLAAAAVQAQTASTGSGQAYPAKPIQMIVPVQAGSGADAILRIVANRMAENMKQQILLDNAPGAAGLIAMEVFAARTDVKLNHVPIAAQRKRRLMSLAARSPACSRRHPSCLAIFASV
ncbi:MAG: hypothetical protein ABI547_09085 [Betaproteobacteria bacterium]